METSVSRVQASASGAAPKKVGPYGGDGWKITDMDTFGITRIVKVGIRHGGVIYGFIVHFERNSCEESTELWGAERGELTEISFEEDEYIMSVSGHVGTFNNYTMLKSLKLETNLRVYGPYGAEDGKPFELLAEGGEIIGLHGRSGKFVDAIGAYVKAYTTLGPIGGGGGGEKREMDPSEVSRIVKIGIRHGGAIDGLCVHYEHNDHEESTELWGAKGGQLTEILFEPNEYITAVRGYAGTFNKYAIWKSLTVETNFRIYGPYGVDRQSFELSAQGGQIIGFHARSGQFVDAIGVYVKASASNAALKKVGPYGGHGGDIRDMDAYGITRTVKIGIRHGGAIDGFIVHFERNGQKERTKLWGAEGGKLTEIPFEENEYLTAIRGYSVAFNNYTILKSLILETNLRTYGPYGEKNGQFISLSAQGGQIIGFHARSGEFIDAIGVYVKGGRAKSTKIGTLTGTAGVGVCYGMIGNNLPSHSDVIKLYQSKGIGSMRIYCPNRDTLNALKGTNIDLIIDAPNVAELSNGSNAATWVRKNILPYDSVKFKYIAVGNEVMDGNACNVLPAMSKIYDAICSAGLKGKIKVSTAVRFDVLTNTYPPSNAVFSAPHMGPIVQFLKNTGAPLLANIYPYFSHAENPVSVSLDFALLREHNVLYSDGPNKQHHYKNVFDAMVDSMYYALEKSGAPDVAIVISEIGWPSAGGVNTTVENARTYHQNLINHVRNGTPKRPGKLETYIFAMFNENQKTGNQVERHFGLFYPDQTPVYSMKFS